MEHVLWVLLVTWLNVDPSGRPTVDHKVHSTYTRPQECHKLARDMMKEANGNPQVNIQCVPVDHDPVW